MNTVQRYDVLAGTLEHVDEEPATALADLDRTPAPWESSMQATCECLSWRGSLDNLDRRRAEDELGGSLYAAFPAHTRSALVLAHAMMDRGLIGEQELRDRMRLVRDRMERS